MSTVRSLEDAFRLQCLWNGDKVLLASALASPVAPLVMLLACGLLEIIKPSAGGLARKTEGERGGVRGFMQKGSSLLRRRFSTQSAEDLDGSRGAGAAFKILTIFFIGGARESATLLRCQLVDKGRARDNVGQGRLD